MSDPILDFETLLAPIPGDAPAGPGVAYTLRQKLRAARKETEPHPDDPSQADIPRKVDWPGLVRLCQDTLTKSKDLEVALQLVEALSKVHGYAGLRDGLHLLRGLMSDCWDRVHPIQEEGEGLSDRADRFQWLAEADRGALFPVTIKNLPLVKVGGQALTYQDRQLAQQGRGPIPDSDFERSVPAAPDLPEVMSQCLAELDQLEQTLLERFGLDGPSLMGLRQSLEECHTFMQFVARRTSPVADSTAVFDSPTDQPNGAPGAVASSAGSLRTREDAYRHLSHVADFLEQLEPHSPIPDLLRRAIELGRMPFRQLVRELIREPGMLAEIRREFGIKEASGEGSS